MGYSAPRISIYDTTAQTVAVANTPQVITFNTVDGAAKITATSPSRFTIIESGRYLIIGRAQINLTGGSNRFINLWIRKNGVDVTTSNSRFGVVSPSSDFSVSILAVENFVAGDFIELWMVGDNTALQITNVIAGGGAPLTQSINLVITKTG